VSSGNRPSSDFAGMLLEVFFIPKTDLKIYDGPSPC
jgi:hypothetical protein